MYQRELGRIYTQSTQIHCFLTSLVFTSLSALHRNHHSRSLEGKVYVLGGSVGIRSREVRIGDLIEFRCSRVYLKVHISEFVYTSEQES